MLGTVIAGAAITVTGQIDPANVNTTEAIPAFMPIIVPMMILVIPIVDLVWGVIRRTAQGRSPFSADAGHLHHRLLRRGHSHTNAVLVLYMWTAVASFSSVAAVIFPLRYVAPVALVVVIIAVVITGRMFERRRRRITRLHEQRAKTQVRAVLDMTAKSDD